MVGALALATWFVVGDLETSEAREGMPAAQQAYWEWVSSLNRGGADLVDTGTRLLYDYPSLHPLYLRLAAACRNAATTVDPDDSASELSTDHCTELLDGIEPPDGLTRLYRDAAHALIQDAPGTDEHVVHWQTIAHDPALDPTLARLVVNQAPNGTDSWLANTERWWRVRLAHDSTAAGVAFGLGYAAILRQDWDTAERLLRHATRVAPDDPQAYRELGRLYHVTSQTEAFETTLTAGVEAARRRYDLEQELALSSMLGWGLAQRSGDLREAERHILAALERSRALADAETEALNLYRLAWVSLEQDRYAETLTLLDSAAVRYERVLPRQMPDVLTLRGLALGRMFRFSDAERVLEAAIEEASAQGNRLVRTQALVALAQLQQRMGRSAAARATGYEALSLAQQIRATDHEIAARLVLGDIERYWGNAEAAVAHLESGLALARQTQNTARQREAYHRLGLAALTLGDANRARRHFEDMLTLLAQGGDRAAKARAYLGLGRAYHQYHNYAEALRHFERALQHLSTSEDPRLRAETLLALASTHAELGDADTARMLLEQAGATAPHDITVQYRAAATLGAVALDQTRYRDALSHFAEAERTGRRLEHVDGAWHVAFGQALAHWRLGHATRAEAAFRTAVDHVEAGRASIVRPANRSYYLQNKVQVYEYFAAFLDEQGRGTEAFTFSERARSRSLVDLLYTTQQEQKVRDGYSTDRIIELSRRLRALADELATTSAEAAPDTTIYASTRAAQLGRELTLTEQAFRQAERDVAAEEPLYTFETLPADSIRFVLAHREAMVVYDLRALRNADASVAYVVLPNEIKTIPLKLDSTLTETIRFFRAHLGDAEGGPGEGWEPAARRLYDDLTRPVVDALPGWVNHLHLVPEGVLNYLPFAALLGPEGTFLAEEYSLSVVPSAGTLKLSRDRNPGRWRSMLLFADPAGSLPGSRREVQALMAQSPNRRHAFVGPQATQANLEELAGQYDILHFATHGRFVSRSPWRSHLELHGGVLSVEEIGRLNLDAYLVTLSACETALSGGLVSDVPSGDEWIGLNQAFLAAGTPTVMASLWPIDDAVSSRFMIDFYDTLGPTGKAQALAAVQQRFIADEKLRHPFYWAAFTVIGDPL